MRRKLLFLGSNGCHIGVLFILAGHFVGLLTPHAAYTAPGLTVRAKQLLAMVSGGAFGVPALIAAEMQYHPAATREEAWRKAALALAIRALLLQEAERLAIAGDGEEEQIHFLLAREIATPEPDEATCRRCWSADPARFCSPDFTKRRTFCSPPRQTTRPLARRQSVQFPPPGSGITVDGIIG